MVKMYYGKCLFFISLTFGKTCKKLYSYCIVSNSKMWDKVKNQFGILTKSLTGIMSLPMAEKPYKPHGSTG